MGVKSAVGSQRATESSDSSSSYYYYYYYYYYYKNKKLKFKIQEICINLTHFVIDLEEIEGLNLILYLSIDNNNNNNSKNYIQMLSN